MHICNLAFLLLFQSFIACNQVSEITQSSPDNLAYQSTGASQQHPEKAQPGAANLLFQSSDGGQTWQDVSEGLPSLQVDGFFAADAELYLRTEKGMYRSGTAFMAPIWEREISLDDHNTAVFPGQTGLIAFSSNGRFSQKINGSSVWLPVYTTFQDQSFRTIFESQDRSVFIGCDNGLFKSSDSGKTWKHVLADGWVLKIVESNGVLLCTNIRGILRSTDGGEHWDSVISEGGVGIAVETIEGGFAAITYNTDSETRRIRTSTDGGKTWQAIDAGLPPHSLIASIKQVGEYFFCGHPDGIFRSSDKGKTWKLLLPAIDKKVFNLSVSGKVIYAVPRDGGC